MSCIFKYICFLLFCLFKLNDGVSYTVSRDYLGSVAVQDSSGGGLGWNNLNRVADNSLDTFSHSDTPVVLGARDTYFIVLTGMNINVPSTCSSTSNSLCKIDGFYVEIKMGSSGAPHKLSEVRLVFLGGQTSFRETGIYRTVTTHTFGSSADLWGRQWTANEINSVDFGIKWKATDTTLLTLGGGAASAYFASVRISYTITTTISSLSTSVINNLVGGFSINVNGGFFVSNPFFGEPICRFGDRTTLGTVQSATIISCPVPSQTLFGVYSFSISLNGLSFTNALNFEYRCDQSTVCSGNGACLSNGTCSCNSGWKGDRCEIPNCASLNECSEQGSCTPGPVCECVDGWIGPSCQTATCFTLSNCSNHGSCLTPNECTCDEGWLPPDCAQPDCTSIRNCNVDYGGGICIAPNTCQCEEEFVYPSCEGNCSTPCFDNSYCAYNSCVCEQGFFGEFCNATFDCSDLEDCSGNGLCIADGVCSCNTGWIGDNCSSANCINQNNCTGNGYCESPGRCKCISGWFGSACHIPSCSNVSFCNAINQAGYCVSPGVCNCSDGWALPDCVTPICSDCSANQTCASPNTCSCKPNYLPPLCRDTFGCQNCTYDHGWNCNPQIGVCNPICGDGLLRGEEECDVFHDTQHPGCDSRFCTARAGWDCNGEPSICVEICGDGIIVGNETCDDGNDVNGDGCSSECRRELGWGCSQIPSRCFQICGDGIKTINEECDDGNTNFRDGCTPFCTIEIGWNCTLNGTLSVCTTICGDGIILQPYEACDDGNTVPGDGCSETCAVEPGWRCSNPAEVSICQRIDEVSDTKSDGLNIRALAIIIVPILLGIIILTVVCITVLVRRSRHKRRKKKHLQRLQAQQLHGPIDSIRGSLFDLPGGNSIEISSINGTITIRQVGGNSSQPLHTITSPYSKFGSSHKNPETQGMGQPVPLSAQSFPGSADTMYMVRGGNTDRREHNDSVASLPLSTGSSTEHRSESEIIYNDTNNIQMSPRNPWEIPFNELKFGKELGKGAYGVVYKAVWNGQYVAVKKILGSVTQQQIDDWAKEADLMRNVPPHKNVVQFLGVCIDPLCIVLQFYKNGSLLRLLKSNEDITPVMSLNILIGIASGMKHLHDNLIVHRDLAARNILLDEYNNAIVSDFGFARVLIDYDEVGVTKSVVGPIRWMAPECMKQKYTKKSDIWSFGVTAWEVITRKEPYFGLAIPEVIMTVSEGRTPVVLQLPEYTNPIVSRIINRCWSFDPDLRPSFREIEEELSMISIS